MILFYGHKSLPVLMREREREREREARANVTKKDRLSCRQDMKIKIEEERSSMPVFVLIPSDERKWPERQVEKARRLSRALGIPRRHADAYISNLVEISCFDFGRAHVFEEKKISVMLMFCQWGNRLIRHHDHLQQGSLMTSRLCDDRAFLFSRRDRFLLLAFEPIARKSASFEPVFLLSTLGNNLIRRRSDIFWINRNFFSFANTER